MVDHSVDHHLESEGSVHWQRQVAIDKGWKLAPQAKQNDADTRCWEESVSRRLHRPDEL